MPAITFPPNPTRLDYTVTPWVDPYGSPWIWNQTKLRWRADVVLFDKQPLNANLTAYATAADAAARRALIDAAGSSDLALKAPLASPTFTTPNLGNADAISITATGNIASNTITATGSITGANIAASGTVSGANIAVTGYINALGHLNADFITASGSISGANLSGTNTGDNAANTTYAADYRAGNFVAGTDYLAPASLTTLNASNLTTGTVPFARLTNTQTVGNVDAPITAGTRDVILTVALTAARTYTLPLASAYPAGSRISFSDSAITLTATNTATLARAGSDLINGAATMVLNTPGAAPILISDGTSRWTLDIRGVSRGGTGVTSLTGIAKGNGTGPYTAAVAGDFPTLNQNTTGTAAGLSTTLALASGGTNSTTGSITGSGGLTFTASTSNNGLSLMPTTTGGIGFGKAAPTTGARYVFRSADDISTTPILRVESNNSAAAMQIMWDGVYSNAGNAFSLGVGTTKYMRIFPSGGIAFGVTLSDPGASTYSFENNVIAYGTLAVTGASTLSTASVKRGGASTTAKVGGSIFESFADVTVGGAEADIFSNTLDASLFGTNGQKIVAEYSGNFVTVGTEMTQLQVKLAGNTLWDSTGVAPTTGTTSWRVTCTLIRVSATVVRYSVALNTSGASGFVYCTVGELPGLTLTGINILKITGASAGVSSGAGDIIGKMHYVDYKSQS